jgi:hypothetical protein
MAKQRNTSTKSLYAQNRESAKPQKSQMALPTELVSKFDKVSIETGFPSRSAAVISLLEWVVENKAFPA